MSCDPRRTLVLPPPVRRTKLLLGAGGGSGPLPPVAVTASRALTPADAGRVLQLVHGVTLTVPTGLPAAFACQLLMPAPQVWTGGAATLAPSGGPTVNGAPASLLIERTGGSMSPWLAWLQRETGVDAYSLVALGATLTAAAVVSLTYAVGVYETGVYE